MCEGRVGVCVGDGVGASTSCMYMLCMRVYARMCSAPVPLTLCDNKQHDTMIADHVQHDMRMSDVVQHNMRMSDHMQHDMRMSDDVLQAALLRHTASGTSCMRI